LVAVLASASEQLPRLVKDAGVGDHLLLVADECHRAGATEMSKVFRTRRRWSLGLSATPEREDDADAGYDESLLGKKLGPVIYEFTLADALREGLVPKFTINHLGLNMTPVERQRYDALSRSISDAMSRLRAHRDSKADGDLFGWARSLASRNQGELSSIAARFVSDTSRRRELLNHMEARHDAVIKLIETESTNNPNARVILFHESIADVMDIFVCLWRRGFKAIAEHSELPASMREAGLEQFRRGIARIIVSARSLIEGFNVPETDVGIIVASTSSVRQRVQSLGRVLRRHRGATGEEKTSCIHVLYAADSVEEAIYGKLDWNETTGVDCNKYFLWDLENDPWPQDGPPRLPLPCDANVDPQSLESGTTYPGQYEGIELSCDLQRNVTNLDGQYAVDTDDLAEAVLKIKPGGGKFRVTPQRHFVLVRIACAAEWETIYVTQLHRPVRFESIKRNTASAEEVANWVTSARPGDPYPFASFKSVGGTLRFKQKSGGVIAKRVRGGEVFARCAERAEDGRKGADAARVLGSIKALYQSGTKVSRIELNEARHVTYREAGRSYFICALEEGLEFSQHEAVKKAGK
jgi:superfamily II DNA or RNA helicase